MTFLLFFKFDLNLKIHVKHINKKEAKLKKKKKNWNDHVSLQLFTYTKILISVYQTENKQGVNKKRLTEIPDITNLTL